MERIDPARVDSQRSVGLTRYTADEVNTAIDAVNAAKAEYMAAVNEAATLTAPYRRGPLGVFLRDTPDAIRDVDYWMGSALLPDDSAFGSKGSSELYPVRKYEKSARTYARLARKLSSAIAKAQQAVAA